MRRVAVTGIGILAPSGSSPEEFWRNNAAGRSWLKHEPLLEALGLKSRTVAPIENFDLRRHHTPQDAAELAGLSRFVQLTVTAGMLACQDASLGEGGFAPERAGTVLSSAIGGTPEFQVAYEEQSDNGTRPLRAFPEEHRFYDAVFLNYPPSWLARRFGLRGPSGTLTTGCTAGLDALGLAFEQIRQGELDIVVAGAGEAPLSGLAYSTLDVIGSLSVAEGPPETASRPFDATRAGFVLGEGAASLVLEDYDHAVARGARVHAEVLGFASSNNAHHMSDLAADGESMTVVIEGALRDAGVEGADIDYVNAHGSSTPQNDVFETQALKRALGQEHARRTPVSSTKSMIGHSLSSASMVGAIAAMGALRYSVVPPTVHYETPDPECDLDYVPNRSRVHETGTALVSASGFGGIHSCAVLRRVGEPDRDWWRSLEKSTVDAPAADADRLGTDTPGGAVPAPKTPAPGTPRPVPAARVHATAGGARLLHGGGGAGGPVTLFLHGFGGTAAHWEPVLGRLGPGVRGLAVDLPGHGDNSLPVDTPRELVHSYLLDVVEQAAGVREFALVGHSLGGLLALDLAAAHPGRVREVAVVGSAARVRLHPTLAAQVTEGAVDETFLAGALHRPSPQSGARRLLVDGFRKLRLPHADAETWGVRNLDLTERLATLPVPVLSVIAACDRVVSPRRSRALAQLPPHASSVVLQDADHYALLENPAHVHAALAQRLHSLRGGPASAHAPRAEAAHAS
ncbi:alpha/beta fold hydrolase [Streptomyces tubbatahanensis]|uniref:Alpha/beta fold hydrolase n=1 Tax=Streptomyces tubbatahanensis TaxID=2923272 RepID=A0ABY3XX48_9ACTN|nr:alpha/beta fold hydrolase [Streptomyces tubbatahanensis]UNS99089.1 alpha/beta fold hydrolase [Streptomyces tubbatahanensis]